MSIKLQYKDRLHKLGNKVQTFDEVVKQAYIIFKDKLPKHFNFQYIDKDNDTVMLQNDQDLNLARQEFQTTLKIFIHELEEDANNNWDNQVIMTSRIIREAVQEEKEEKIKGFEEEKNNLKIKDQSNLKGQEDQDIQRKLQEIERYQMEIQEQRRIQQERAAEEKKKLEEERKAAEEKKKLEEENRALEELQRLMEEGIRIAEDRRLQREEEQRIADEKIRIKAAQEEKRIQEENFRLRAEELRKEQEEKYKKIQAEEQRQREEEERQSKIQEQRRAEEERQAHILEQQRAQEKQAEQEREDQMQLLIQQKEMQLKKQQELERKKIEQIQFEEFKEDKQLTFRCIFCDDERKFFQIIIKASYPLIPNQSCYICKGTGKMSSGHKFVRFMDEYLQKVCPNLQRVQLPEEPKIQQKEDDYFFSEKLQISQKEVNFRQFCASIGNNPVNQIVVQLPNLQYSWEIQLINSGTVAWPENTSLYCIQGDQISKEYSMKTIQRQGVLYINNLEAPRLPGAYQNYWRLGYQFENQIVHFGPKIGYELRVLEEPKLQKSVIIVKEVEKQQNYDKDLLKKAQDLIELFGCPLQTMVKFIQTFPDYKDRSVNELAAIYMDRNCSNIFD